MSFRDQMLTCSECEETFFFTVTEQRRLAELGQSTEPPELCSRCRQRVKYAGKLHGSVKWFNPDKGYGFLVQDDSSEIFFHRSGVTPSEDGSVPVLEENQEVLYDVIESPKGPQAVKVEPYG